MRIGIVHYKVGGTDGVSLEIDKWKSVLEKMGHEVVLAGGDLGRREGKLIEGLFHHSAVSDRLFEQTFRKLPKKDEHHYKMELSQLSAALTSSLRDFIIDEALQLVIVENIWSVAENPAAAVAMAAVMQELSVEFLSHNHDFYWEQTGGFCLSSPPAVELAEKFLPPHDRSIQHVVISTLAQEELAARKGIESVVIPNVFDFDSPPWVVDDYTKDFRQRIGLSEKDLVVLQATRIVERKAIEMAVDFVKALDTAENRETLMERGLFDGRPFEQDSRIVLVLAGYTDDDRGGIYVSRLEQKIEQSGIDAIFISDFVDSERHLNDGQKIYSLWDTYVLADFVTYPSLWEGWGNQLLEVIKARKPFLLYEYPVYRIDIAQAGFRIVSLGSGILKRDHQGLVIVPDAIMNQVVNEALELLCSPAVREEFVEHNYQIATKHYSLQVLQQYLEPLIDRAERPLDRI